MKELIATPVPGAFEVSSMALLLSVCILFPFAGILSDRYGRKRIMVRFEFYGIVHAAVESTCVYCSVGTRNFTARFLTNLPSLTLRLLAG